MKPFPHTELHMKCHAWSLAFCWVKGWFKQRLTFTQLTWRNGKVLSRIFPGHFSHLNLTFQYSLFHTRPGYRNLESSTTTVRKQGVYKIAKSDCWGMHYIKNIVKICTVSIWQASQEYTDIGEPGKSMCFV